MFMGKKPVLFYLNVGLFRTITFLNGFNWPWVCTDFIYARQVLANILQFSFTWGVITLSESFSY